MTIHAEEDILTGLQNAAGNQTPPSGPSGPAASQGALGPSATAEAGSADPAFGGEVGGAGPVNAFGGDSPVSGERFLDYFNDPKTTDEQKNQLFSELDTPLGKSGSGVVAKVEEVKSNALKNADMPTLSLLLDYGWTPESEQAFGGKKNLGSEFTVQSPEQSGALRPEFGQEEDKTKPKWDRNQMGGFLMEFGLRMMASEKKTTAGAFGESALGTVEARGKRKKEAAAEGLAKQDRERKASREEEADQRARNEETRRQSQEKRRVREEGRKTKAEARKEKEAERKGLTRIQMEDGTVEYGKIEEGVVTREDGSEIKGLSRSEESLESLSSTQRADVTLRTKIRAELTDALSASTRNHPNKDKLDAIKKEKDSKKRQKLIEAYEKEQFSQLKNKSPAVTDNPLELQR